MKTTLAWRNFLGVLAITGLAGVLPVDALELVKDGKAAAVIVAAVPRDAPAAAKPAGGRKAARLSGGDEALAVSVLVDWIKKITDTELAVAPAPVDGLAAIYVGQAAVAAGLKLEDIPSASREGVRLVIEDRRALIGGQNERATLKAVCRFLEELGCRYFMEGPLGEVYPRSQTLALGPRTITESPGLLGRNPKGPTWPGELWRAWNGAGGPGFQHQHAWGGYVGKGLYQEHPEYFALGADGQRKNGGWLCTANKELRKHFADQVIAAIAKGARNPSISPPDGRGYCQCAACRAQDDPNSREPSSGVVSISNRYVDFYDEIARRVAAVYPDSVLSFYCYADYTQPPTVKRKLPTNLCAVIAPIRYCRLHEIGHAGCPSREQQQAMIEGWAAVASRLGYYNYLYNLADATLPFFKFTACQKEFPYLHARGLAHMTIEVLSNWHIYGPQIYLSLRLAYQPQADAAALMEDYWQKFYGPRAAPFMKQYWLGMDAEQGRLSSHAGGFFGLQQIYTPAFLKRCADTLTQAAEAARGDPVYAQRVALHTEGYQSAVEYRQICDAMNQGDFARASAGYERLHSRLRGLAEKGWANREYATAYLERFFRPAIQAGAVLTSPPNRLRQVLPDAWRLAFDEPDQGLEQHFAAPDFDDSKWPLVSTYSKTLDAQGFDKNTLLWCRTRFSLPALKPNQGLALFFGEVDGYAEVFVNGQKMAAAAARTDSQPAKRPLEGPPPSGPASVGASASPIKPRLPFVVDITSAVRPGENVVALRVDHSRITELALGGILRPVLLVDTVAAALPSP